MLLSVLSQFLFGCSGLYLRIRGLQKLIIVKKLGVLRREHFVLLPFGTFNLMNREFVLNTPSPITPTHWGDGTGDQKLEDPHTVHVLLADN